jgi:hypothetical protein
VTQVKVIQTRNTNGKSKNISQERQEENRMEMKEIIEVAIGTSIVIGEKTRGAEGTVKYRFILGFNYLPVIF